MKEQLCPRWRRNDSAGGGQKPGATWSPGTGAQDVRVHSGGADVVALTTSPAGKHCNALFPYKVFRIWSPSNAPSPAPTPILLVFFRAPLNVRLLWDLLEAFLPYRFHSLPRRPLYHFSANPLPSESRHPALRRQAAQPSNLPKRLLLGAAPSEGGCGVGTPPCPHPLAWGTPALAFPSVPRNSALRVPCGLNITCLTDHPASPP